MHFIKYLNNLSARSHSRSRSPAYFNQP